MFTRLVAPRLASRHVLQPVGAAPIWTRWRRSLANRDGRGYIDYRWHFAPLTPRVLATMERRKELYAHGNAACLLWAEPDDDALYGSVLAGGREALLLMRRAAALRGRDRVELFLPRPSRLVPAARTAGFVPGEWGRAAILYERPNPLTRAGFP